MWLIWKPRGGNFDHAADGDGHGRTDRHGYAHGNGAGDGETDAERIAASQARYGADEEGDTVGHPDKHETRSSAAMTLPETPAVDVSCYCVSSSTVTMPVR